MIASPVILLTILAFMAVIGPLVFVHEMGHYLAGRLFGVKADAFSIGFGHEIAGFTDRRGTRWKFGWLPLGGYVKFAGDMNPASTPTAEWLSLPAPERQATFQAKPVWQRAIIVAAGPLVNFALAIIILGGFAMASGDVGGPSVVGSIQYGSPAASIGLREGDQITALAGTPVTRFADMVAVVQPRAGRTIAVAFERDGTPDTARAVIGTRTLAGADGKPVRIGLLGVGPPPVSLFRAPLVGVRRTGEIVALMAGGLRQIVLGERSVKELGGPIGIARISGQQAALGFDAFVFLLALISINLGFINLLPVPMLDGGHLFFYAIEVIRRRPVEPWLQEWAFRGGLAAILALMLLVTFNDLGSLGLWKSLAGLIG